MTALTTTTTTAGGGGVAATASINVNKDDIRYIAGKIASQHIRKLQAKSKLNKLKHHHQQQQRRVLLDDEDDEDDQSHGSRSNEEVVVDVIQKVPASTIKIESILGMGGFSTVYKARIMRDDETTNADRDYYNSHDMDSVDGRFKSSKNKNNNKNKKKDKSNYKYYALKCLNAKTKHSKKSFTTGALDLAMEAYILSKIAGLYQRCQNQTNNHGSSSGQISQQQKSHYHEHIIQLHGVAAEDMSTAFIVNNDIGYFLLLDVLQQTLTDRLTRWRKRLKAKSLNEMKPVRPTKSDILHRIQYVALGVAKGLCCLSNMNIVLRDLKVRY